MDGAYEGTIKALYIVGENPIISDPDSRHVEDALKKLDLLVVQDIFLTETARLADVVLPASTFAEKDGTFSNTERRVQRVRKAIEPVGESRPDWQIVCEIARKLGKYDEVMEGKSLDDLQRSVFESMGVDSYMTWEDFKERGYFVFPVAEDWEDDPPGLRLFYKDPEKNPLPTPSGKLEFYSKRLAENFPDDTERSPIPRWIEKSTMHDERVSCSRAKI